MFSAQNKPTIVNEGLTGIAPISEPPQTTQVPQAPLPQSQEIPKIPVAPPINPLTHPTDGHHQPPKPNGKGNKAGKFIHVLIPAGIVVGVMVVASILISQYKRPQEIAVSQTPMPTLVPSTPVPTIEPNPLKDWKAYVNRANEISFKYPPQVKLTEEKTTNSLSLTLTKESDGSVELAHFVASSVQTPESLLSTYVGSGISHDQDEDLLVSGVTAKTGQLVASGGGEGVPITYVYLTFEKVNFLFTSKTIAEKDLFMQILSTIRFVTPGVTDEWKDFTSTSGGFSLKYPPSWVLSTTEEKVATTSAKTISIRKNEADRDYQNINIQISSVTGKESVQLTATELISSLQNLSGWNDTPTLDFRNFGSAQAQIISGVKESSWSEYGVFWIRNTLVQISWKDTSLRQEQSTFDDILSTLKFR